MGTKRRQILHFEDKEKISFSKLNFGGKKGKSHLTGELCCSKMSSSSLRDILILFKFWQNLWAADHFLNGRHSCSYCQHRSKLHFIKQNCSGSRFKKKKMILDSIEGIFSFLWVSENNKNMVSTHGSNSATGDPDVGVTTDQLQIRTYHYHHHKTKL